MGGTMCVRIHLWPCLVGNMGMAGNTCVLLAVGVVFLCEQDCTAMLLMC